MNNDTIAHIAGTLASGSEDWRSTNAATRTTVINAAVDAARALVTTTEKRAWQSNSGQPTGIADQLRALPIIKGTDGGDLVNRGDLLRILEAANV